VEWLIWAIFGLLIVSIFMPLVGTWLPGCRHWVLGGFRLRYLAFALLFFVLGGSLVIRGLLELDWGSLAIGIVMLVWGGVWLYGRGVSALGSWVAHVGRRPT
jgi:hypothetical protein